MASIATSINLYDRISAPINNIIAGLDRMCAVFETVEGSMDGAFDPEQIYQTRQAISAAAQQMVSFGNVTQETESKVDGLTKKVMGLVGAYASLQGVQKLVNLSDEYVQTTARLNMIVDEYNTIDTLQNKIFASAQRSRASYADTADMVAKLSQRTGDLFSNDEAILFAENLNKLYTIAGASQQDMASSQLQLLQAMGSGVLRGEEFNAVYEAAPNIMQAVADAMGEPVTKLREMAADGLITADIVKNAMLGLKQETLDAFEEMPMTWSQVWTGVMNRLYMASQPILEVISWLAQHWSVLEPIILGVSGALLVYLAATKGVELATKAWASAQAFLNGVMALNPVFLIIMGVMLLIALFYAVIAVINKVTGKSLSATGMIAGAVMTAVAFIWNLFLSLLDFVLGIVNAMVNPWLAWVNFFANVFKDPIGSVIHLFGDFADNILGIIESIARGIDKVFGSHLADSVGNWRDGLDSKIEEWANKYGNGKYEAIVEGLNLSSESLGLKRMEYSKAYDIGYNWGASLGSDDDTAINLENIAANTEDIANAVDITNEDLKYLRDIAERDVVNRFTTAEIKVEMTNNNSVSSNMDLDGMVHYLALGVNNAMEMAAEGVHV